MYIFKFDDQKMREKVLENGTWVVAGRPMVVYKWKPNLEPLKFQLTSLPIWVKLHNVPPEYWTEEGISCVASAIGNPLYVDAATEKGNQMGFMKVCVEVQVEDKLPNSFPIRSNGKEINIKVEYPWKPVRCTKCKVFGHSTANCKVNHPMDPLKEESGRAAVNTPSQQQEQVPSEGIVINGEDGPSRGKEVVDSEPKDHQCMGGSSSELVDHDLSMVEDSIVTSIIVEEVRSPSASKGGQGTPPVVPTTNGFAALGAEDVVEIEDGEKANTPKGTNEDSYKLPLLGAQIQIKKAPPDGF